MDIKMKFGWEKGRRVVTEMNVSLEPQYVIGNEEFVRRLGEALNKVVNHDRVDWVKEAGHGDRGPDFSNDDAGHDTPDT